MTLVGFEIENWSCIERLVVRDLPATGVVVLHAPNGTGKSSLVAALRACLFDYANTTNSKAISRWLPKQGTIPRIAVEFRAQGGIWRVTKQYKKGGRASLESRKASGSWMIEATTAAEVHERTQELVGGTSSSQGLAQLLWQDQADFQLPNLKADDVLPVKLRSILGGMQTAIDDQFLRRVKTEWLRWYTDQSKPGRQPRERAASGVPGKRDRLVELERDYRALEDQAREVDAEFEQMNALVERGRALRRESERANADRDAVQEEYQQSLARLEVHVAAKAKCELAENHHKQALAEQARRTDKQTRLNKALDSKRTLNASLAAKREELNRLAANQDKARKELDELRAANRTADAQRTRLRQAVQVFAVQDELARLIANSNAARTLDREIRESEQTSQVAPSATLIARLRANRTEATKLRARLDAAAWVLGLEPNPGSPPASIVIDAQPAGETRLVRQSAEVTIPLWGRIRIARGSDGGSLAEIEAQLQKLEADFAASLQPFGIDPKAASALDQLADQDRDFRQRMQELDRRRAELKALAPAGIKPLENKIDELQKRLNALSATVGEPITTSQAGLEGELGQLDEVIQQRSKQIAAHEANAIPTEKQFTLARTSEAKLQNELTALETTVASLADELMAMPHSEELAERVARTANEAAAARQAVEATQLSERERDLEVRLSRAKAAAKKAEDTLAAAVAEYHTLRGKLSQAEGLHERRAVAAVRVDQLKQSLAADELQMQAVDRLYTLFEECRESRVETLIEPIRARVQEWLDILAIRNVREVRFNDRFLPEKLLGPAGAIELHPDEESYGTREQLSILVRLALGTAVAAVGEPTVAVLDDPLTHSDRLRMSRMRQVLYSAGTGPLQVIVLSCKPHNFADDRATMIDLAQLMNAP